MLVKVLVENLDRAHAANELNVFAILSG